MTNSLRLRRLDVRPGTARTGRRSGVAKLRDAAFLALTAFIAVGVAAGVLAADRAIDAGAQQVTITAHDLRFEPDTIHIRAGSWVAVELVNEDAVFHDWAVEGIQNVDTPARPGQTSRIRFIVDTPGTYRFVCAVPGHAEAGMTGTLVVD